MGEDDSRQLFSGEQLAECIAAIEEEALTIDILQLPLTPVEMLLMPIQATLREALDILDGKPDTAIHVSGHYQSIGITISGIVTLEHIERFYRNQV